MMTNATARQITWINAEGVEQRVVGNPVVASADIRDGLPGTSFSNFQVDGALQADLGGAIAEFGGDVYFSDLGQSLSVGTRDRILRFDARTRRVFTFVGQPVIGLCTCLLYTSDAADE